MRWTDEVAGQLCWSAAVACATCHLCQFGLESWCLLNHGRELQLVRDACWEWERVRTRQRKLAVSCQWHVVLTKPLTKVLDSGLLMTFGWGGVWAQDSTLRTMSDRAALPLFTRTGFLEPPAASSAARWPRFLENPGGSLFVSLSRQFPQERKLSGFRKDLP